MARRNSPTTEPSSDEATEPQTTEAPVEASEPVAEASTEASAEAVIDLGPFQEAVNKAVESKEPSTGEVSTEAIAEVNTVYRSLDGIKPKNAAKNWLEDEIKAAIMPPRLDAVTARAFSMIKDNLTAAGAKAADKAPADPTQAYIAKVASLRLALQVVEASAPEGEGLDDKVAALVAESEKDVTAYNQWLAAEVPEGSDKPEAPEVSPVVRTAFKLAQGKASGSGRVSGGSGVRRSIEKHVSEYFADKEVGHFATVAEIANYTSNEYGADKPSQGAVSARLFAEKLTIPGIESLGAGEAGEGKPRGARKTA